MSGETMLVEAIAETLEIIKKGRSYGNFTNG